MRKDSHLATALVLALGAALSSTPAAVAAAPATTVYASGATGLAAKSAPAPASAPAAAPSVSTRPRGARRIPRSAGNAPALAAPAQVSGSTLAAGVPASLLSNFNGVSSRDSALSNFGQEFEPPDQGLCVGNGYVLEMVNSAYTVYTPAGKTVTGPFNVNGPFGEGLTEFTSDPRCYYEAATHTWYATVLAINKGFTASTVDVAVNTSGDPTTVWTDYRVDTTDVGGRTGPRHKGCPCLGDQPTLGVDQHNLYFTTNEFALETEQFNGAQIYALAKKDLLALSPTVHFAHFDKLEIGGAPAASVQPAISTGTPKGEFFLSALDPTETFDQRIGVWSVTEGAAVAKGEVPKLSSVVLGSEAYGPPPPGEQRGSSSLIDGGDDRMQQVQYKDGSVWGELGTALTLAGDPVQRAGAGWFQVEPRLGGGTLKSASIKRQGYVALPGNYLLYPALQVGASGTAAMVMTLTGAKHFPSAAFATLAPGASSFGPVTVAASGSGPYDPEAERWGDYSFAAMDPAGSSVWLATEYMPPKSSQTPDGQRNWGTRVFDVPTP
ncbi:MAG TPA: hypothetical protein VII01_05865 [Solirubrobacteraceae bacterium]|jgi:hypothetical protein